MPAGCCAWVTRGTGDRCRALREDIVNTLLSFVAEATTSVSVEDIKHGYGSLIFTGCFFLALIVAAIWWIKRST